MGYFEVFAGNLLLQENLPINIKMKYCNNSSLCENTINHEYLHTSTLYLLLYTGILVIMSTITSKCHYTYKI